MKYTKKTMPDGTIEEVWDWGESDMTEDQQSNQLSPCRGCSNHPSNGGSGVCFCTLPLLHPTAPQG